MAPSSSRAAVLALFRAVVATARGFPDRSVGRKLLFNARELIRLRRHERDARAIAAAVADGHAALRVYALLAREPQLLQAATRKPHTAPLSTQASTKRP